MGDCLSWKFLNASVLGTSHGKSGLPCQDECICDSIKDCLGNEVLIAVVSDGAGSAKYANQASETTCSVLFKVLEAAIISEKEVSSFSIEDAVSWVQAVRLRLKELALAQENSESLREFACTVVAAMISENGAVYFQVGDGAIVIGDGEVFSPVFWPENGEFPNETAFITEDEFAQHIQYLSAKDPPKEIALFSDGLQRLALKFADKTAHTPFFLPMFKRLRLEPSGISDMLNKNLVDFLNSANVNDRTDDDKSLVLASRI